MKSKKMTYKNLLIKFSCQLLVVVLTLNIGASIILAFESKGKDKLENSYNFTKEKCLEEFSLQYNISSDVLSQFLNDIDEFEDNGNRSMAYVESLLLVISIFFTIGWGHIVPVTGWGRLVSVISALLGIPLSFLFIYSGSQILLKIVEDVLKIVLSYNSHNRNKYAEAKLDLSRKRNLIPTVAILFFTYFLTSTYIISNLEGFSYADGLWYSFITLSTIGLGDLVQGNSTHGDDIDFTYGQVLFTFIWLSFGYIIIGTFMLVCFAYAETNSLKELRFDEKENKDNFENSKEIEETSFLCPNESDSASEHRLFPFSWHPIFGRFSR